MIDILVENSPRLSLTSKLEFTTFQRSQQPESISNPSSYTVTLL